MLKKHLGVFSILISYTFISIFWYLIFKNIPWKINNSFYLMMALVAMSVISFCRYHEHTFSRSFNDLLGNKPKSHHFKEMASLVFIFIIIGIGASALLIYIESFIDIGYSIKKWNLISRTNFAEIQWLQSWLVLYGITVVIIAPITEELLFRGLILNRLLIQYSPNVAIFISALVFALAHYHKSYISSFIHGVILAIVAIRYGSLYYPMIIHGIYNAVVLVLQKYFGIMMIVDIEEISTVIYWLPEFMVLFVGLVLFYIYYKKCPMTQAINH